MATHERVNKKTMPSVAVLIKIIKKDTRKGDGPSATRAQCIQNMSKYAFCVFVSDHGAGYRERYCVFRTSCRACSVQDYIPAILYFANVMMSIFM